MQTGLAQHGSSSGFGNQMKVVSISRFMYVHMQATASICQDRHLCLASHQGQCHKSGLQGKACWKAPCTPSLLLTQQSARQCASYHKQRVQANSTIVSCQHDNVSADARTLSIVFTRVTCLLNRLLAMACRGMLLCYHYVACLLPASAIQEYTCSAHFHGKLTTHPCMGSTADVLSQPHLCITECCPRSVLFLNHILCH